MFLHVQNIFECPDMDENICTNLTYYVQKSIRTFKTKNGFEPFSDAPKVISVWKHIYDTLHLFKYLIIHK